MLNVQIDSFSYFDKVILKEIAFKVSAGEHISILGESGSGKTTLLHLIYGLFPLKKGEIFYKKKQLIGPEKKLIPGEPFMKLVAQEFNVMPFSTVRDNVYSYLSGIDQERDEERIDELLKIVDLDDYKNTLVKYLSGGQKQRVALAKALADEPEILLLDEPFSNIDPFLKNEFRCKLFQYLKSQKISCISATHDSDEALAFSDRILLIKDGKQLRYENPETLYKTAKSKYEASFFGEVNLFPAKLFDNSKSSENQVVYASQLKAIEEETSLEVKVIANYFQGSYYLVQADWNGKKILFQHPSKLKVNNYYFLTLDK